MNSDFPRIITFLRKERGLSQKQVAADLGISQALLSHYEKGIRECGLDFLVKAADYFEVSCDYLLGRTVQRRLASVSADDLPESDEYMTIGGLILHEYQSFPKLNEVVKIGHFQFRIIKNTMTKIELVKLKVGE